MNPMEKANQLIRKYEECFVHPSKIRPGMKLYTGVDLGTAYIVLAVVDEEGTPVAGAKRFAQVVRDGLVVDYMGAIGIVRELKESLESQLGVKLDTAGTAYPPGTVRGDQQAIKYVAEAVGFEVEVMVDEPTAANEVLGIVNGAVVDVGGGTTGIAILKNGNVTYVADEPTGGTHLSLVLAGAYRIPFAEAESLKTTVAKQQELLPIIKPVIEKIASIITRHVEGHEIDTVYLAGGTCCFQDFEKVVQKETGLTVVKPDNPFLVTPLGIALSVKKIHTNHIS